MVRITAQLVKTEDGFHVWSETYDKKLDDIFEIQDEIARAVANQLALSLGLSEQELVPARTKDVVAYQKYLEAKDLFHKRGRENLERALLLLHEVTARDPDFAPAWTSVASVYIVLEYYEPLDTPAKTYKQWRAIGTAAAKRAIALNPNDAEAYINLAGFLIYDLKWIPAFDAFEKAQNFVGDDPDALDASAQALLVAGYAKEAKALSLKSIAADPLVGIYHNTLGTAYFRLGDVEGQIAESEKAISLSPDLTIVYRHLLNSYISVGRFADALPLAAEAIKRGFFAPEMLDAVKALQVAWSDDSALKSLVGRYDVSIDRQIAIKLGDEPALMSELEKGWNAPHQIDPNVMYLPTLVMSDPRWKAKVKSLGLYDLWKKRGFPAICKPVGRDDFECAGEPVKP
ncbi:MAG TPA: hypothetical protein VKA19_13835 [Alphaproteobacteria bacterium]|nr:hypothetical protein [Alphaproteobacteria bacterium]